jgi:UDP-GlcNAc:undecaprenyl-phosphate GlcNAc-1-phosphate transferase
MRDYILTLLVAAAVTYLLTPLVRRLAIRAGAMFEPRARDVHTVPVPRMGGLAMYAGLAAGLLVAEQIPQLRQAFGPTGMVSGLLLAGGLLVVIGLIDDKWGMSALTKLAGQIAAGAILVATGTQLNLLPLPGGASFAPTPDQSTLLTILVVVATINAVNFIDGLDGLAAGIVTIAAASFLIYYYEMAQVVGVSELAAPALASAILTGVCLGFLPHNFHPARIFMGDTGAMLLGLVLAYAPISSISSLDPALWSPRVNRYPVALPLLLPAAILVIPYLDLLLAVIRRTRAGKSPFAADSNHLHHRLIDIGHSQRASVLVMYLWAAVFSGSIVWFSLERVPQPGAANHHGQPVLVFVVITGAAVVALVLLSMPWLRRRDQSGKPQPAAAADAQPGPDRALAPAGAPVPGGASPAESQAQPAASPPARSVVGSVPPADPWLGPRSDQFSWRPGPNGAAGNGQRPDPRYDSDAGNGHRSGPLAANGHVPPDGGPAAGPETPQSPAVEVLRGSED